MESTLLAVKAKTGNPTAPESTTFLTMAEGEKDDVIELIKMYPGEEKVDISDAVSTPMTLSMKENGFNAAAPAAAAAGGRAGIRQIGTPAGQTPMPGVPVTGATLPGVVPSQQPQQLRSRRRMPANHGSTIGRRTSRGFNPSPSGYLTHPKRIWRRGDGKTRGCNRSKRSSPAGGGSGF